MSSAVNPASQRERYHKPIFVHIATALAFTRHAGKYLAYVIVANDIELRPSFASARPDLSNFLYSWLLNPELDWRSVPYLAEGRNSRLREIFRFDSLAIRRPRGHVVIELTAGPRKIKRYDRLAFQIFESCHDNNTGEA
jgi:hypothetical protein